MRYRNEQDPARPLCQCRQTHAAVFVHATPAVRAGQGGNMKQTPRPLLGTAGAAERRRPLSSGGGRRRRGFQDFVIKVSSIFQFSSKLFLSNLYATDLSIFSLWTSILLGLSGNLVRSEIQRSYPLPSTSQGRNIGSSMISLSSVLQTEFH